MKILHTADWHLGKRLEKFSRLEEQKEVLAEIVEIADAQDVDAVLVAGDLFDSFNPSTEAIELLFKTLKRLTNSGKRAVVAIAGNHDSPDRIEAPDPLARECGIIFAGYPDSHVSTCELESGVCVLQSEPGFVELKLPRHAYPLRLLLTRYANEYRLKIFLGLESSEASLSLALALAESVQQQNKAKQNFFFLDEGFGSLDKESLQVAFETLKSLRKENRKVGIISHVEELQQEIDMFLTISNDVLSGSRIRGSWE